MDWLTQSGGFPAVLGQTAAGKSVVLGNGLLRREWRIDPAVATDEASAMEALGLQPRLVTGDTRNLKVTYPHDLELAALILERMEKQ